MVNLGKRKTLDDLTIKHNFMFAAVMMMGDNCKRLLEMVLGIEIESVVVEREKSIIYHPEYKGVRLDVIAKDENRSHYNVEMQVQKQTALGKRSRYYHSQIDMELLERGEYYDSLPNTYVIFVCDFDPFDNRKYKYSFRNICLEDNRLELKDGCETVFLSTKGENEDDVPEELVKFLKFVEAKKEDSDQNFDDDYVKSLQESVKQIKDNRTMKERYMIWQEMLRDERNQGKIEYGQSLLVSFLMEMGEIPEEVERVVMTQTDPIILNTWIKIASKVTSIEQFMNEI